MVKDLRSQLTDSLYTAKDMEKTIQSLRRDLGAANTNSSAFPLVHLDMHFADQFRLYIYLRAKKINDPEKTVQQLNNSQQKVNSLTKIFYAHQQKHQCETLFVEGHIIDAAKLLFETVGTVNDDVKADTTIKGWLPGKSRHCRSGKGAQLRLLRFY